MGELLSDTSFENDIITNLVVRPLRKLRESQSRPVKEETQEYQA